MIRSKIYSLLLASAFIAAPAAAQITLIGDDAPHGIVADGDFNEVWASWRLGKKPPFWTMKKSMDGEGAIASDASMGVHFGKLFSSNRLTIADSQPLTQSMRYQVACEGDILAWEFGADVEYKSDSQISLSLLFADREVELIAGAKLKGSDGLNEHFSGRYTLTAEDAASGIPSLRLRMESAESTKIFVDYINVYVIREELQGAELTGRATGENEVTLSWSDKRVAPSQSFNIYRTQINPFEKRQSIKYTLIGRSKQMSFVDRDVVAGRPYTYLVTRDALTKSIPESGRSNRVEVATKDSVKPSAPSGLTAKELDSEVVISWRKSPEKDVAYYSVERLRGDEKEPRLICKMTPRTSFEDIVAPKGTNSKYQIYAHDYSGNRSEASEAIEATVRAVYGASFSDLIRPMPITSTLRSDTWGAAGVLPRDTENGIESPDWSYWGGRPVLCRDGKYHMVVTRWSESSPKGHWEWPFSTLAQVVADKPTGPYRVVKDLAYEYEDGYGHNPDIILMRDGTYALYSLIKWKPTIFTSKSMEGPWELLGEIKIDMSEAAERFESIRDLKTTYQFERNLSGVETADGRIIIVSKFGAMMVSEDGLLGKYKVVSEPVKYNKTLPAHYQKFGYEDPVMWQDSVQFHQIINAFIAKRAIYLRSGDGINWVYDTGVAYTNDYTTTTYEDGTVNEWDKLERPHVIQDRHGRATHLSLAAIDVDKDIDYGSDGHSSKNLIIPLTPHTLLSMVSPKEVTAESRKIVVKILAEEGFSPATDVDIESLHFGASSVVDFGGGLKAVSTKRKGGDLEVTFSGTDNGIKEGEFALKLLGKKTNGELIVGYTKLTK